MDMKFPILFAALLLGFWAAARQEGELDLRQKARKAYNQGNYKEAYETYRKLAIEPQTDSTRVGEDLKLATDCLRELNRVDELDVLWEGAVQIHENNWRLLFAVAQAYFDACHSGYIIAGEFRRGRHRGGGRYVNVFQRDRIRALQLMTQAMARAEGEQSTRALSDFCLEFANMFKRTQAWRFQYRSDLSTLPDYGEEYRYYGRNRGAPVHPDGNPVFYAVPKSYEAAKNDGERWRWLLTQAMKVEPGRKNEVRYRFAEFLREQFGVQTITDRRGEASIDATTL